MPEMADSHVDCVKLPVKSGILLLGWLELLGEEAQRLACFLARQYLL
jgi:hypothetical protein